VVFLRWQIIDKKNKRGKLSHSFFPMRTLDQKSLLLISALALSTPVSDLDISPHKYEGENSFDWQSQEIVRSTRHQTVSAIEAPFLRDFFSPSAEAAENKGIEVEGRGDHFVLRFGKKEVILWIQKQGQIRYKITGMEAKTISFHKNSNSFFRTTLRKICDDAWGNDRPVRLSHSHAHEIHQSFLEVVEGAPAKKITEKKADPKNHDISFASDSEKKEDGDISSNPEKSAPEPLSRLEKRNQVIQNLHLEELDFPGIWAWEKKSRYQFTDFLVDEFAKNDCPLPTFREDMGGIAFECLSSENINVKKTKKNVREFLKQDPRMQSRFEAPRHGKNFVKSMEAVLGGGQRDEVFFLSADGRLIEGAIPLLPVKKGSHEIDPKSKDGSFNQKWLNAQRKRLAREYPKMKLNLEENRETPFLFQSDSNIRGEPKGTTYLDFTWENANKRQRVQRILKTVLEKNTVFPESVARLFALGIPGIESQYRPAVGSDKGALGLWQLIPLVAEHHGLTTSPEIQQDERTNLEKSTTAALAQLEDLHDIFQNDKTLREIGDRFGLDEKEYEENLVIPFTVTAYCAGPGNVRKMFTWFLENFSEKKIQKETKKDFRGEQAFSYVTQKAFFSSKRGEWNWGSQSTFYYFRVKAMANLMEARLKDPNFKIELSRETKKSESIASSSSEKEGRG